LAAQLEWAADRPLQEVSNKLAEGLELLLRALREKLEAAERPPT
jgi:hypothetical protein